MIHTIGETWRCPENAANRSDSLDVPVTAVFMQMSEQMTVGGHEHVDAFLIVRRPQ